MKVPRNRAWRRRKARTIGPRIHETKAWLMEQFSNPETKGLPKEERKRHKPGKLTRRQQLRALWSMNQELADGI